MKNNEAIVCADGFAMSVQASASTYCRPRVNSADRYQEVEVGFPSEKEDLQLPYIDAFNEDDPRECVYAYVPAEIVTAICAKHGGIVTGELPAGIPYLVADP